MQRFIDIDQSAAQPAQSGADAAQWVEIYFPDIDNLLQRLVRSYADERIPMRSSPRSWAMVTACVIGFTCLPGYDTDASSLSESENIDPSFVVEQPLSAKADRLPLIQSRDHVGAPIFAPRRDAGHEADLFEPVLRGSIEHIAFAAPSPAAPPSIVSKSRRSANRAGPAKRPLENQPPAASPPSLFEKLFGMILQSPRQT